MNRKHLKSTVINVLKIAFSGGLIYWLVSSGRFDLNSLKNLLSPGFVAIALALIGFSIVCGTERWRTLLVAQGFSPTFFECLKLNLIGIFFNYAMPGGVGGDLIKGYYVVRSQPHRKFDSAMTVLMDRIFGLYIMVTMAAASVFVGFEKIWNHPHLHLLVWLTTALFLGFTCALAIGFSQRIKRTSERWIPKSAIGDKILQIWEGLLIYRKQPLALIKVGILSTIGQFVFIGFFVAAGSQLGFENIPLSTFFIACLIGAMITAIPISPAGIGVGQAAFAFLFAELAGQQTSSLGASLATANQGFQFFWGLVGAFFYLRMKK